MRSQSALLLTVEETALILGAVYAGTGRLSIWLVALLGFVAAVMGDSVTQNFNAAGHDVDLDFDDMRA